MLWGALALLLWQVLGIAFLRVWRKDLAVEAATGLTNMLLWPAGIVAQGIVWPIYRRRRERARQARLTQRVAEGKLDPDFARRSFNWKG